MAPITLKPKEEAVLDAIVRQRLKNIGDIFELDLQELQKELIRSGFAMKYTITRDRLLEIIMRLSDCHIVDMDWIVDMKFINNYRSVNIPDYKPNESVPDYYWANKTEWAYRTFQLNGRIGIEKANENDGGKFFARMAVEDIDNIKNNFKRIYKVQLLLNKDRLCLLLKINNENPIPLPPFKDGKTPYMVIKYAYDHPNKQITRGELRRAGINLGEKYLKSQVFSDNDTIKALSPLFIDIKRHEITFFKKPKMLNLNELNSLKVKLKII